MNTLKAKIMLLLLAIATLTVLPTLAHADGNPIPDPPRSVTIAGQ